MHQQYLSIQDTHAPALANTRNPRMRYTRAPRRGLIVASQFFPFFIKRKKNIVPSHLETRRYPDGRPRSGPIPIRIGAKKAQTANGQLDACFMFMRACVPRNYNSNRPNSLLFPANHSTSSHMTFERLIQQISKLVIQE